MKAEQSYHKVLFFLVGLLVFSYKWSHSYYCCYRWFWFFFLLLFLLYTIFIFFLNMEIILILILFSINEFQRLLFFAETNFVPILHSTRWCLLLLNKKKWFTFINERGFMLCTNQISLFSATSSLTEVQHQNKFLWFFCGRLFVNLFVFVCFFVLNARMQITS